MRPAPGMATNQLIANDDWPSASPPAPGYCAGLDAAPSLDSAVFYEIGAGETVLIRVSSYYYIAGQDDFVLTLPEPGVAASLLPTVTLLGALCARRRRLGRAKVPLAVGA